MPIVTTTSIFLVSTIVVIAAFLGRGAGRTARTGGTVVTAVALCLSTPLFALNVTIAVLAGIVAWVLMPVVAVLASGLDRRRR